MIHISSLLHNIPEVLSLVSVAEPEPVEPKLFEIWSRSGNYLFNKYLLQSVWRLSTLKQSEQLKQLITITNNVFHLFSFFEKDAVAYVHHACGQFCRKTRTSKIKRQINRKMDRIIIVGRTEREIHV